MSVICKPSTFSSFSVLLVVYCSSPAFKAKVLAIESSLRGKKRLILLQLLPLEPPASQQSNLRHFPRRSYMFTFILADALQCRCPELRPGKTYVLMMQGSGSTPVISIETFAVEWDESWRLRLELFKRCGCLDTELDS